MGLRVERVRLVCLIWALPFLVVLAAGRAGRNDTRNPVLPCPFWIANLLGGPPVSPAKELTSSPPAGTGGGT